MYPTFFSSLSVHIFVLYVYVSISENRFLCTIFGKKDTSLIDISHPLSPYFSLTPSDPPAAAAASYMLKRLVGSVARWLAHQMLITGSVTGASPTTSWHWKSGDLELSEHTWCYQQALGMLSLKGRCKYPYAWKESGKGREVTKYCILHIITLP